MTDQAQLAVERALARIMAARHPGTAWVPASLRKESGDSGVVRLLAPPTEQGARS